MALAIVLVLLWLIVIISLGIWFFKPIFQRQMEVSYEKALDIRDRYTQRRFELEEASKKSSPSHGINRLKDDELNKRWKK